MKKSRGVSREGMNPKAFSGQTGHALQGSFQISTIICRAVQQQLAQLLGLFSKSLAQK